jgi:hypothetical protein
MLGHDRAELKMIPPFIVASPYKGEGGQKMPNITSNIAIDPPTSTWIVHEPE